MMALLINFFDIFSLVFNILLLIRVVLSFITRDFYSNWFYKLIFECTEPILGLIRKVLPGMGGLDFSPLVAFLLLELISYFLHSFVGAA